MLGLELFSREREVLGSGEQLGWESSLGATGVIGPMFRFPILGVSEGERSRCGVTSAPELLVHASREETWPLLPLPLKPPHGPQVAVEASRFPTTVTLVSDAALTGT